ncbi:MAG: hypothetical protein ACKVOI_10195 [Dongiaceae bacterium]
MQIKRVVQIMPAPGWRAKFSVPGQEKTEPLVCWGLVENMDCETRICGFVAPIAGAIREPCESLAHFRGYVHHGEHVTLSGH